MILVIKIALVGLVLGCATYTDKALTIRAALISQRFDDALKKLDEQAIAKSKRDLVLYKMERGKIFYLQENYQAATKEWDVAYRRIEELYTVSVSNEAAALAFNESWSDYEGELHERVLLVQFSALAYFADGEPEKAIVEARRANNLLATLAERSDKAYAVSRDTFILYLNGLIYETRGEWDSAIIDYRRALEAAKENRSWMGEVAGPVIAESLGRLAEFRGRSEILGMLRKDFPNITWTALSDVRQQGEVFLILEEGNVAIKKPEHIIVPVSGSVVRLSWPSFYDVPSRTSVHKITLNGQSVEYPSRLQDISALARQALSARRVRDSVRLAARVFAKDQAARAIGRNYGPFAQLAASIVGAASESPDTRSWISLPRAIHSSRILVPANQKSLLKIEYSNGRTNHFEVDLKPGQKKLIRVRNF